MSTMTFDAAGIIAANEVSSSRSAQFRHQAPRRHPVSEVRTAPAKVRRAGAFFGLGSAVSVECDSWARWTGI